LQSGQAKELLKSVGFNQPDVDSVIFLENNLIYLKSEAFIKIADSIGGFYKIFSTLKIFPLKWLNIGYDFVARKRHKFISDTSVCCNFNTIHNRHL